MKIVDMQDVERELRLHRAGKAGREGDRSRA
jgi:hypothetical protein